jgi:3-phenylpropionate/cinnamic acid dioxygenase small subunit
MYEFAVRVHDGGTPRTKHFTTNLRVVVDEDAGTARASAYYCVTQATPELPLQVVVTGSYRDTFHVVDGRWWFDTRVMVVDQVGDTSQHLAF